MNNTKKMNKNKFQCLMKELKRLFSGDENFAIEIHQRILRKLETRDELEGDLNPFSTVIGLSYRNPNDRVLFYRGDFYKRDWTYIPEFYVDVYPNLKPYGLGLNRDRHLDIVGETIKRDFKLRSYVVDNPTIKVLKQKCRMNGIKGYSKCDKAGLYKLLMSI